MPNTPDTVVTLLPCPFCQHRPGAYETRAVELFYRHDATGCILDDLRITPEAIDKWNTRMNQALDTADLQQNEQSVESGSASSTGVETDMADEGMVKWHIPTMLRWLAENIDSPRLPDGTLAGRFLYAVAENIEHRKAIEVSLP